MFMNNDKEQPNKTINIEEKVIKFDCVFQFSIKPKLPRLNWAKNNINNAYTIEMLNNLIHGIPTITRIQIVFISILTFLVRSQIVSKHQMYFSLDRVMSGEIWRLITSWLFFQKMDLYFLLRLIMFGQFSSSIQKSGFKRGSIDYLYFTFILFIGMIILATIFSITFLTNIYFYTLCYFYGRVNSNQFIIINFLPVRAPFLLWFILMFQWIVDDPDMKSTIVSVFLGHTLYFLFKIYPKLRFVEKKDLFETPRFMVQYLSPYFQREIPDQ